jgi:hypothetical protein
VAIFFWFATLPEESVGLYHRGLIYSEG